MKTYALPVSIIILAIAIYFGVSSFNDGGGIGSVAPGNDYSAAHITSADTGTTTLKFSAGSIGSVVVSNSSSAAEIGFYDTGSTTIATSTGLLLFLVDPEVTEGTLQYDVEFTSGLLIDVSGAFDGDIVVTYR